MAADRLAEGIQVNCVNPGAVAYPASPLSGSTTGTSIAIAIAVYGCMQTRRLRPAGQ